MKYTIYLLDENDPTMVLETTNKSEFLNQFKLMMIDEKQFTTKVEED